MTDIDTFLTRQSRVFLKCIYKPFRQKGIITYLDLVREAESEMDSKTYSRLKSIINAFPDYFKDAANSFNDELNVEDINITHLLNVDDSWIPIWDVTTKELQAIFKKALNKTSLPNFEDKLGITNYELIDIIKFRKGCRNQKLRHIHFRLIHNDFFTYSKMFRFKMSVDSNCPRCNMDETTAHLLWECPESNKIWSHLNEILEAIQCSSLKINKYEDLYKTESNAAISTIKIRIIQELIQIERPKNWCKKRIIQVISQLRDYDLINSKGNHDSNKAKIKWLPFLNLKTEDHQITSPKQTYFQLNLP
jgi:hypothetical protein